MILLHCIEKRNRIRWKYIFPILSNDNKIWVLQFNASLIKLLKPSKEFLLKAIEKNSWVIKYIDKVNRELQEKAISLDDNFISVIKNPDTDLCIDILSRKPELIYYATL